MQAQTGEVRADHLALIPTDKGLTAADLARLRARGEPRVYRDHELKYIGMPVSGICTGQVYLSGDGRLCRWDVFKAYGGRPDTGDPHGPHYAHPVAPQPDFEQGFAIRATSPAGSELRRIDASGFHDVSFQGSYPIGTVAYRDAGSALGITLEAYSPFVPLDAEESGLPATVMTYTVTNTGSLPLDIELGGWMENRVCPFAPVPKGVRRNHALRTERRLAVTLGADVEAEPRPDGLGNMTLSLLEPQAGDYVTARIANDLDPSSACLDSEATGSAEAEFGDPLIGAVVARRRLDPGASVTVSFVASWYFPHYSSGRVFLWSLDHLPNLSAKRRYYGVRFGSSAEVADYVAENFGRLDRVTRSWTRTWYDSTLPYWFLDRTFANTSTLATQTCHRFEDGRFYAWEGVDSCPGTVQHVWQYAQAVAHVFPMLERNVRETVDFGLAWHDDGSIDYRAEASKPEDGAPPPTYGTSKGIVAIDGLAGTVIRAYREHKASPGPDFLERIWPRLRQTIRFLMSRDADADGLIEGPQYHTLDATWFGRFSWISSLYLGALACGKAMATEMADSALADECDVRLDAGRSNIVSKLFNGSFFEHQPDPAHPETMDMSGGCYIDQVLGQSFAHQIGFERVVPATEARSALQSLWRFNFAPDVGPYRRGFDAIEGGRWYALPGDAGLIMCTWPFALPNRRGRGQASLTDHEQGAGITSEGYLNECMTGFEHQAAAHMIAEGMVDEGLAVIEAIHDRYHAAKRNPWNEIECGDHYARAMASFGAFITASGFDYHGPRGLMRFTPRIGPEDFRGPFIASQGWGTFRQKLSDDLMTVSLMPLWGSVFLTEMLLAPGFDTGGHLSVKLDDAPVEAALSWDEDGLACVRFEKPITVECGKTLDIILEHAA